MKEDKTKDNYFRFSFLVAWFGLLIIFYYTNNKELFITDLLKAKPIQIEVNTNADSNARFQYRTYEVSPNENTCLTKSFFVSENLISLSPKDTQRINEAILFNQTDPIINSLLVNYDQESRLYHCNEFSKTLKHHIFIWEHFHWLFIIFGTLLFLIVLLVKYNREHAWALNLMIILAFVINAFYVYLFGGIFISPFGMIVPTILLTLLTTDLLKFYQSNKNFSSFLYSGSFVVCLIVAHICQKYWGEDANYNLLLQVYFNQVKYATLNWTEILTIVSFGLGIATIKTRANDMPSKINTNELGAADYLAGTSNTMKRSKNNSLEQTLSDDDGVEDAQEK